MPALVNSTEFDHHTKPLDASCPSPKLPTSSRLDKRCVHFDFTLDDEDDECSNEAKKRECASRVAAWINQSAVRTTAVTFQSYTSPSTSTSTSASTSSLSSSTSSLDTSDSDVLDFDLDVDSDFDLDLDSASHDSEPHILYATPSQNAKVIHAPVPRRPSRSSHSSSHHSSHGRSSRSRNRGRHQGYKLRMPSPLGLYVIQEEDAE